MVHRHHASIWHRYGDIAPQILDARTWTQKKDKRKERERGKGRRKKKSEKEKR